MGLKPRLVMGDTRNIKVTFTEDLAIAEMILLSRQTPGTASISRKDAKPRSASVRKSTKKSASRR
jgi:hypothetical protein